MSIDNLTIGDLKELMNFINQPKENSLNDFINEKVIIRTYSAGVWFGTLDKKAGNEVILSNARRLWYWHAAKSISLSAVAKCGVKQEKCKFAPTVSNVWIEAIEIIPCTGIAIESIEGVDDAET